jgi:hypothetical protein
MVLASVDSFSLQHAVVTLSGCFSRVVRTVSKLVSLQEALVLIARKLTAAIRVKQNRASIRSAPHTHPPQCGQVTLRIKRTPPEKRHARDSPQEVRLRIHTLGEWHTHAIPIIGA